MSELLMNIYTDSVDTRENWYAKFKASDYAEWFGFADIEEMKKAGAYDVLCWDDFLEEVEG